MLTTCATESTRPGVRGTGPAGTSESGATFFVTSLLPDIRDLDEVLLRPVRDRVLLERLRRRKGDRTAVDRVHLMRGNIHLCDFLAIARGYAAPEADAERRLFRACCN